MAGSQAQITGVYPHRRAVLGQAASAGAVLCLGLSPLRASAQTPAPRFKAHAIPTPNAKPYIIVPGPDGNLWFAESGADKIGRLNPKTGELAEFEIPTKNSATTGIVAGGDGNLWFSENATNKIGRITPAGVITEFTVPTPDSGPNGMHRSPDGSVWFAEAKANKIATISFDGTFTEYAKGISPGSYPLSVIWRDGVIWFSEPDGNRLGKLIDGVATEIPLAPGRQPRAMMVHPDGNIWFVATSANRMVRVDRQEKMTEFAPPTVGASLRSLAVTPDGNIWFTEDIVNKMGVMAPDGRMIGEYDVPAPMKGLRGMTTLSDGRVFFSAYDSGHIGELIP